MRKAAVKTDVLPKCVKLTSCEHTITISLPLKVDKLVTSCLFKHAEMMQQRYHLMMAVFVCSLIQAFILSIGSWYKT